MGRCGRGWIDYFKELGCDKDEFALLRAPEPSGQAERGSAAGTRPARQTSALWNSLSGRIEREADGAAIADIEPAGAKTVVFAPFESGASPV